MKRSAVIVAGGSSTRAGFDKVLAKIAGRPVIECSISAFESCVDDIVVVARPPLIAELQAIARSFGKVSAIVRGGERRQDSVRAGLDATSPAAEFVAVHDAARPLITPAEIERVYSAAEKHGAAVLARPITDTLKSADAEQFVSGSIDRRHVFAMQTPQVFGRALLMAAYDRVVRDSLEITDEVSAVQMLGRKIAIVPGQEENMKITFARDLAMAELILQNRANPSRAVEG